MKGSLLSIFVFFTVLAIAYGLKCYDCTGEGDKCAKDNLGSSQEKTCQPQLDTCMRIWRKKHFKTSIASSCSNLGRCDAAVRDCEDSDEGECIVGCCRDDLCNAGSPVSFSVFLMTVSAALGLALLK
ncbi:hypothetical protein ACROYT_G026799 [Oculina patagonica]